ncbi:YidB family protein [Hydrogenophaga sp.]|uniref:YidB family protein n=1 Tax=Hydrogenophaga sp. TaxID=1904254 RepID=UPI00271C0A17|nr:YidB family protein [Hydrogenophaga sp.]MDO9437990.1 YidB family protein [Hydrogenophaga sp.]
MNAPIPGAHHWKHTMGLLDSLIGAAANANAGNSSQGERAASGGGLPGGLDPHMLIALVGSVLASAGGLQGLLAKLQSGGLGDAVQSWIGTGANQPVSGDQLGSALGPDLMGMIAAQLGGSREQASGTLADLLPGLVDKLTPKGQLPDDNALGGLGGLGGLGALLGGGQGGGNAGDLMGMLGGLMGKR